MIYEAVDRWNSPFLSHHGIKGMKWGHRKQRSISGTFHRVLAANNRLNARTYRKLGNNTLASTSRNSYLSIQRRTSILNKARYLGEDEIVRNGVGYYRPRQVARSGRKIGKLAAGRNWKTGKKFVDVFPR